VEGVLAMASLFPPFTAFNLGGGARLTGGR
jgi:hypothetical protein